MTALHDNDRPSESDNRREALRKIGVFGGYTAPMMLAMLSAEATAQASGELPPDLCPPEEFDGTSCIPIPP